MENKTFTKESLLKEIVENKITTTHFFISLILAIISIGVIQVLLELKQIHFFNTEEGWGLFDFIKFIVLGFIFLLLYYRIIFIISCKLINKAQFDFFKANKLEKFSKEIEELINTSKSIQLEIKEDYSNNIKLHIRLFLLETNTGFSAEKTSVLIFTLKKILIEFQERQNLSKEFKYKSAIEIKDSYLNYGSDHYFQAIRLIFLEKILKELNEHIRLFQAGILNTDLQPDTADFARKAEVVIDKAEDFSMQYLYFFNEKIESINRKIKELNKVQF